jgi:hypothetical protein
MRTLTLATLTLALACAGSSPPDQPEPMSAGGERRTVFEHTFTFPSAEKLRLDMTPGTYRAEMSEGGVQLRLVPLRSGVQPPTVRDLVMGRGPTGGGLWEVVIHVQETYELEVSGGRRGESATFRMYTVGTGS